MMFGQNKPRPAVEGRDVQVHEVFYTLQGEGPFAGHPAVFVRVSGCNLRCWFCDTKWDDDNDATFTPEEVVDLVDYKNQNSVAKLVVLTGGEPLRHDLSELITLLSQRGYHVQIETSGSIWNRCVQLPGVTTVISPKTKVNKKFYDQDIGDGNYMSLAWKYVLADEQMPFDAPTQRMPDGKTIGAAPPAPPPLGALVYMQAIDEQDEAKNKANLIWVSQLCLENGFIFSVQTHKLAGLR